MQKKMYESSTTELYPILYNTNSSECGVIMKMNGVFVLCVMRKYIVKIYVRIPIILTIANQKNLKYKLLNIKKTGNN